MNPQTLQNCRRKLEQIMSRVRTDAETLLEQTRAGAGGNSGSELSNAPLHLGDMGTEEFLYDLNAALLENEQYIVAEAREALVRLENGNFGKCESCGRPIAEARLQAMPFARQCVRCAAADDSTPQVNIDVGRPRTPNDTLAPEGEMHEDRRRRVDPLEAPMRTARRQGDSHAAGTAGGGTAVGGLAGSNEGDGDPTLCDIDDATGSGNFDVEDDRPSDRTPLAGPSGGAVGGTPARKRSV